MSDRRCIRIQGASEHNLKHLDLEIPLGQLTVISGVSGSGKSSLAFDTLYREAQRRFLELLPGYAKAFTSGLRRPAVEALTGLGPGVAVDQRVGLANPRSTVGTLSELWDLLRLLFARAGVAPPGLKLTRGLFSFNGEGACPCCQGLGVEDTLELDVLVGDAAKSLREGALTVTTPFAGGYLMYSQVTLKALDALLRAHGGDVDTPWRELSDEVRRVVLYGSDRLPIPLGKHTLETRLKWKGITARPQAEGFYRGLVPVMEEILRGKRNEGILRFARTGPCSACAGSRLREEARSVTVEGKGLADLAPCRPKALADWVEGLNRGGRSGAVVAALAPEVRRRAALMEALGLGHLSLDRPSPSLGLGEARRLRLLALAQGELRDLLVVLDEPSAGLHPTEVPGLVQVLRDMVARGQTVVVVDHDPQVIAAADHGVVLGPGAGAMGGLLVEEAPRVPRVEAPTRKSCPELGVPGRDAVLLQGGLNVVAGLTGAGKSTLLERAAQGLGKTFSRVLRVDAEPIGRTPRSCIATYTGAMDLLRDRYAATPAAKARGLGKGAFSFNTEGGCCEACQGAGVRDVGMRHIGAVEVVCEACDGRRFRDAVLEVQVDGLDLAAVLDLEIGQALSRYGDEPRLRVILQALADLGLGYLSLGHRAPDLSGGEAQRVRLATELARAGTGSCLVVLDEPLTGLHGADGAVLVQALLRLRDAGHTLLVAEHHPVLLRVADRILELEEGRLAFQGTPSDLEAQATPTARVLRGELPVVPPIGPLSEAIPPMVLEGVQTHSLKGLEVSLPFPGFTVVTGPSGSGKSSLVFDTLLAEAQGRFSDLVSPWARRLLPRGGGAVLAAARDLRAALAVASSRGRRNPRSTVGSVSGIDTLLRLLFSREGAPAGFPASAFSPHTHGGACPACRGLGFHTEVDPVRLVSYPFRPLDGGALDGTRFGAYLGERDGQHMATLRAAALALGVDLSGSWSTLEPEARALALDGAGDRAFDIVWQYRRGTREGSHAFRGPWRGLRALVQEEAERLQGDPKGEELEALRVDVPCSDCGGARLAPGPRAVLLGGCTLPELQGRSLEAVRHWAENLPERASATAVRGILQRRLETLLDAGLAYLTCARELGTLSGGEAQRLRLVAALTEGLSGIAYLLDEPTQGLHRADVSRLVGVLKRLAAEGNAVVVVEHDAEVVRAADHVLELGPGAGPEGGQLMAAGSPEVLTARPGSHVARLLAPEASGIRSRRAGRPGVRLLGAHRHTLKDLDVTFPSGAFCVVVGPSGSGKSTLVLEVLAPSLRLGRPMGCAAVEGAYSDVLVTDQEALPVSGLSTVATLLDLAKPLRKRFAASPEAKRQGLSSKAFSLAHPGGRCEACEGRGILTIPMDLMPDVVLPCEACGGRRFKPEVLAVTVEGLDLAQALALPAAEALERFPSLGPPLRALVDLGLGYLPLGQEGATLSEGELQRLRLARLLGMPPERPVAVLLDEPTRGLGPSEVDGLLGALGRLADQGHLVVAVTHHPRLQEAADWTVELGPGGGPEGGRLMRMGP